MIYTLEVPLFVEPTRRTRTFFKHVENPSATGSLLGMFWKGNLTFTYYDGKKSMQAVLAPVNKDTLSATVKRKYERMISIFVSKLNCTTALIGKGCEVNVQLEEDFTDEEVKKVYGKDIKAMIIVTVNAKNTATEVALNTFFTVVEKSPLNLA